MQKVREIKALRFTIQFYQKISTCNEHVMHDVCLQAEEKHFRYLLLMDGELKPDIFYCIFKFMLYI